MSSALKGFSLLEETVTRTYHFGERWNEVSPMEKLTKIHWKQKSHRNRQTRDGNKVIQDEQVVRSCNISPREGEAGSLTILGYTARFYLRKNIKAHSLMIQRWLKASPWRYQVTISPAQAWSASSTSWDLLSIDFQCSCFPTAVRCRVMLDELLFVLHIPGHSAQWPVNIPMGRHICIHVEFSMITFKTCKKTE